MSDESSPAWSMRSLKRWLAATPENRDDLVRLVQDSRKFLEPDTVDMLEGVLGLPAIQVREIMTPRPSIIGLNIDDEMMEILPVLIESAHSRFPVFASDERDNIVGILLAKDLLRFLHSPHIYFDLNNWIRQPVYVPETARSDQLMRMLKHSQSHIAVVVDEFGSTSGIVTLEDLLEEIVGEIEDEHDQADPLADCIIKDEEFTDAWLVQALTPIDYFNEQMQTSFIGEGVETIGGLLLKEIGRVTDMVGEQIMLGEWQFTILTADVRSITMLRAIHIGDHTVDAEDDPQPN